VEFLTVATAPAQGRYEAVFFDFDGVLADTEPVHYSCWRDIMISFGVSISWEEYRKYCIGIAERPTAEWLCRQITPPLDFDQVWAEYPRKQLLVRERLVGKAPFSPDLVCLLKSLSDYKLAVVSSSRRIEVEPALVAGGIRPLFGAVVCGEDVERHKPAPDPYLLAARLLAVKRVLVVEDSEAGVESAEAAGLDAVRVAHADETPGVVRARLSGNG